MHHRAGGISTFGRLERANRCAVVEAEQEVEALVKVFLRFGRVRRNLSRVRPEAFEEGFLVPSARALVITSAKTKLLIKPVVCMGY